MQINRLFEIVYMLMNKKAATAKELSDHFEVSQRTIYRDIDILNEAGIPVYTNKGKGGGISILDNFLLNKSVFSDQEQNEILFALQSFRAVKYVNADTVLTKLSAIFKKSKDIVNWVEVDFSDWTYNGKEKFNAVKSAIIEKKCISFNYYGASGEKTHRKVYPMQLWFKHRAWYIKAYCLMRKDFRLFKISRIQNILVSENDAESRELFKLDLYNSEISSHFAANQNEINNINTHAQPVQSIHIVQSEESDEIDETEISILNEGNNVHTIKNNVDLKLLIHSSQAHRVYDEFNYESIERDGNGNFIVRAIYPEEEWLYGYILSFNYYIEVLEPLYFRDKIIDKLQKTLMKYL